MSVEESLHSRGGLLGKGCNSPSLCRASRLYRSDVLSRQLPNMEPDASQHRRNMLAQEGQEDRRDVLCGLCQYLGFTFCLHFNTISTEQSNRQRFNILDSHSFICAGVSEPHDRDVSPVSAAVPVAVPPCALLHMAFSDPSEIHNYVFQDVSLVRFTHLNPSNPFEV